MESKLLGAFLKSREAWDKVSSYIHFEGGTKRNPVAYTLEAVTLLKAIGEYYSVDGDAAHVDPQLLLAQLEHKTSSEKQLKALQDRVEHALAEDVSPGNVSHLILLAKRYETSMAIATQLVDGVTDKNQERHRELLAEYVSLLEATDVTDLNDGEDCEALDADVSVMELVEQKQAPENTLKLFPKALNDAIGGGLPSDTHTIIFGRPNSGKSALAITIGTGACVQGKRVLHFDNEDGIRETRMRYVAAFAGRPYDEFKENPSLMQEVDAKIRTLGYENLLLRRKQPGTPELLRALVAKYKPDVIIVNQTYKLYIHGKDGVQRIADAAEAVRNLEVKWKISVSQAGDSASNKALLDMSDLYGSRTELPGAADLIIGVGVTSEMEAQGYRTLSLPKCKINGNDGANFTVRLTKNLSTFRNVS